MWLSRGGRGRARKHVPHGGRPKPSFSRYYWPLLLCRCVSHVCFRLRTAMTLLDLPHGFSKWAPFLSGVLLVFTATEPGNPSLKDKTSHPCCLQLQDSSRRTTSAAAPPWAAYHRTGAMRCGSFKWSFVPRCNPQKRDLGSQLREQNFLNLYWELPGKKTSEINNIP